VSACRVDGQAIMAGPAASSSSCVLGDEPNTLKLPGERKATCALRATASCWLTQVKCVPRAAEAQTALHIALSEAPQRSRAHPCVQLDGYGEQVSSAFVSSVLSAGRQAAALAVFFLFFFWFFIVYFKKSKRFGHARTSERSATHTGGAKKQEGKPKEKKTGTRRTFQEKG
jgi:hypothetical protein